MNLRGGYPYVTRGTASATSAYVDFQGISLWLRITADAAVRIYFTKADATANNNRYVSISATIPFEGPLRTQGVYVVAPTGSPNFEICAMISN